MAENPLEKPDGYEIYQSQIVAAIEEWCCTLPQIKRYAGIERSTDISDILEWMVEEEQIVKKDNGVIIAFFLSQKVPAKFWLNGDGKIAVSWDEETPPVDSRPVKKGILYTEEMFFNFGKRGLNVNKMAKELGIASGSVTYQLKKTNLLKAYQDGVYGDQKTGSAESVSIAEDKKSTESLNLAKRTAIEAADETELLESPSVVIKPTEDDEAAWNSLSNPFPVSQKDEQATKVVEARLVGSDRHSETLSRIKPEKSVIPTKLPSPNKVSRYQQMQDAGIFSNDVSGTEPSARVTFGAAGTIEIFADLNLFQMDAADRDFVNRLITEVQNFKANQRF